MSAETAAWERRSVVRVAPPVRPRKLAKVPFVELADGRLQGVVSSGSDTARVYVSSIAARTHGYNCSTNNNRPCGGLRGAPCGHLRSLVDEAVLQYGLNRVARYLHVEVGDGEDLMSCLDGAPEPAPAAAVFSRFLHHLAYLELPGTTEPIPELHWFPATRGGPLMLGAQLAELLGGAAPGIEEALALVAGFDDTLVHGFARLDDRRAGALAALAGAVRATPLGPAAEEAAGKVAAGSIADEHLAALAGARTALLGAVHDAQLSRLDAALGRDRAPWEGPPPAAAPAPDGPLGGCRSWLRELAIAGWRGVDHDLVSAADQTVAALLAEPGLRRPAVLLDGLAAELRASCPVATAERLPVRRWADLWARALLLSRPGGCAGAEPVGVVSGRLLPLGVDVHEHGTAVQMQVHGVLEPAGSAPPRLVRASVAAAKVDTIAGPALWRLLDGHPVLLTALAEHRSVEIADLPVLAGGDLLWRDGQAAAGEPASPFTTARILLADALAPPVPPLDRHPVRIAEPVLVEGYTTDGDVLDLGGSTLAFDLDRLPACGPLTPELVAASSACVGLLRWDGGRWSLQPLAVQATVKRRAVTAHNGDWALGPTDPKVVKAQAKAGDAVAVLRERAGRLLRR